MRRVIFFDMDGVLCDFDKAFAAKSPELNLTIEQFNVLPKPEKDRIKENLFTYEFFRTMEPIPKGMALFQLTKQVYDHVHILTAHGDSSNVERIRLAKERWASQHLNCDNVFFTTKAEHKHIYLRNYNLQNTEVTLIDDRPKALDPWIAAGGIGILFKNN